MLPKNALGSCLLFLLLLAVSPLSAEEPAILRGIVRNVDSEPVSGVEIFIYDTDDTRRPADFITMKTTPQGEYRISLPAAAYWLVARLRHGEKYGPLIPGDKHSGEPVDVQLKPATTHVEDFVVVDLRDSARLQRQVRDDFIHLGGRILGDAEHGGPPVFVFANRELAENTIPEYISAWVKIGGRYSLFVPKGRVFIGYSTRFPLEKDYIQLKELFLENDSLNFDIIIDGALTNK